MDEIQNKIIYIHDNTKIKWDKHYLIPITHIQCNNNFENSNFINTFSKP